MQDAAAKQYVTELKRVGIVSSENKATGIAQKWRQEDSYLDAVDEIAKNVYPAGLLEIAPPGQADRQKVTTWFSKQGLGDGAAGNKAATYLLITARVPQESPLRSDSGKGKREDGLKKRSTPTRSKSANADISNRAGLVPIPDVGIAPETPDNDFMPLNVKYSNPYWSGCRSRAD